MQRIHDAIRDLLRITYGYKKPLLLRSPTARVFAQPANPEFVAMMRVRKLQDERPGVLGGMGNLLSVEVTPADVQDRDGARLLFKPLTSCYGWLKKIWQTEATREACKGKWRAYHVIGALIWKSCSEVTEQMVLKFCRNAGSWSGRSAG